MIIHPQKIDWNTYQLIFQTPYTLFDMGHTGDALHSFTYMSNRLENRKKVNTNRTLQSIYSLLMFMIILEQPKFNLYIGLLNIISHLFREVGFMFDFLYVILCSSREFFTRMETSPLPVQTYARHALALAAIILFVLFISFFH